MAQYDDKEDTTGSEYQFQEDQENPEYKYEEQPIPEEKPVAPKKRPIMIVVIALVVLFILYEIIHAVFFGKPKENFNEAPQPTVANAPAVSAPQPMNSSLVNPMQQQAANSQALSDKIDKMQADNQASLSNLEKQQFQTQTNVMSLQETVNGLSDKFNQVSESLQSLADSEQALEAQARRAIEEKRRQQIALRKMKQYFVDAVIPGRAWLKGMDGSTITVTVGQKLPGYGTVTLIDPYSGVVRTTTGKIPYGTSGNT